MRGINRTEKSDPTVMFEAFGFGKPFVGTKVGRVPEIIISDDYGLLVEPANPEELAETVLIALDKEWDDKIKMILKYAERFEWENIAKEIIKTYDTVLLKRRDHGIA